MAIYSKITCQILKVLTQPGRLFFVKGSRSTSRTYESFSPEYLLLVQERARIQLTTIPLLYRKNAFLSFVLVPVLAIRFIFLYVRLCIVNQIIQSYLNSNDLKQLLLKKHENINT